MKFRAKKSALEGVLRGIFTLPLQYQKILKRYRYTDRKIRFKTNNLMIQETPQELCLRPNDH